MGNYALRTHEGRNVKGTGAVIKAIEQLQSEGIKIRLDFVHNVPSRDIRYITEFRLTLSWISCITGGTVH